MVADSLRRIIYELDQARCAYCHTPVNLTVSTFEIDHIVPKSRGGETSRANLCLTCPTCNRHKGIKVEAVDLQTNTMTPLFHPRQDKWEVHFGWDQTSTIIVGRTIVGRGTVDALKMNRERMIQLRALWRRMGASYR